jgi:hypothetical protein
MIADEHSYLESGSDGGGRGVADVAADVRRDGRGDISNHEEFEPRASWV